MTPELRLLPEPRRPYAALKQDLVARGWEWAGEPQSLPLLPGEPEWVEYRHPAGGKLRYELNPAIGLREIHAEAPADLLSSLGELPQLRQPDILHLLDSTQIPELLLGLFAARALRLVVLVEKIHTLCRHPDELVQRTAADVARTLPELAFREGLARLQAIHEEHPDRSALLAVMTVADRRQVLRWLGKEPRLNPDILAALRTGLDDDDDEVRATAALVAARLGAEELQAQIRALSLPADLAAAHALATKTPFILPPATDDASLLLHALLEPLPAVPPAPPLPRHLRREGSTIRLARSGLEVVLVPAAPAWLGAGPTLRRHTPRPFAIAAAPLDERAAAALALPTLHPGPLALSLDDATTWVRQLGVLEGISMRLPSPDEWETALRGPDGRRFPAGNLAAGMALSPWGLTALETPEWLASGELATGVDPGRHIASSSRHPVRFVLSFPM